MNKFWELLKASTIVQASLTLMLGGTICYLWASGQVVPSDLLMSFGTILGFWFGTKAQQYVNSKGVK